MPLKPVITAEIINKLDGRSAIKSFSAAVDPLGRVLLLKILRGGGDVVVLHIAPALAFHVCNAINHAKNHYKWKSTEKYIKENGECAALINEFYKNQPEILKNDWNNKMNFVITPTSVEPHSFENGLVLGWLIQKDNYMLLSVTRCISSFFVEYVSQAEKVGRLVNPVKIEWNNHGKH